MAICVGIDETSTYIQMHPDITSSFYGDNLIIYMQFIREQ